MIRDVKPADLPAIMEIWNVAICKTVATFSSQTKTHEDLVQMASERCENKDAFMVAADGKEILGFAAYRQFRPGNGYRFTFENTIYLDENAQGKGVGRALMDAIEDHARARKGHSMIAAVTASNTQAVAFHTALGYTNTALLPQAGYKFECWHDLLLMQKRL